MRNRQAFHIIFVGRVQGVGFRYFVQKQALDFRLTGWVKNKSDGSVEIEVEGDINIINAFIETLKIGNGFSRVDRLFKTELPETNDYESFFVKY